MTLARRNETGRGTVSSADLAVARALSVPLRRRILDLVRAADGPMSVGDLTDTLGCNHNTIRQHLAVLRDAGLVADAVEARHVAGRPRLLYTAVEQPNPYARLARTLLLARRRGLTPRAAGREAGRATAASPASDGHDAVDALERDASVEGFAPRRVTRGRQIELVLEHCPLADVAAFDASTVCSLHRGLAEGLVSGVGGARIDAFVAEDAHRAGCRIRLHRTEERAR